MSKRETKIQDNSRVYLCKETAEIVVLNVHFCVCLEGNFKNEMIADASMHIYGEYEYLGDL